MTCGTCVAHVRNCTEYTNAALLNVQKPGEQPARGAAGGHALLHCKGKEKCNIQKAESLISATLKVPAEGIFGKCAFFAVPLVPKLFYGQTGNCKFYL